MLVCYAHENMHTNTAHAHHHIHVLLFTLTQIPGYVHPGGNLGAFTVRGIVTNFHAIRATTPTLYRYHASFLVGFV